MPTYAELSTFIVKLKVQQLSYDNWYFLRKIYFPIMDIEIDKRNLEAIKAVFFHHRAAYCTFKNDNSINLLELGLSISSEDTELLNALIEVKDRYFSFTIHEVPWGVLYDMNGASVEQTLENLEGLNDYQSLAVKLNKDRTEVIEKCRFYYQCWIRYLTHQKHYANFEECISRSKVGANSSNPFIMDVIKK